MISTDRNALLCDMAETYGIYDFRALPVSTLAALAVGLRENSRIKTILHGEKVSKTEVLLAAAVDRLSLLVWFLSEDGSSGANRPRSVLSALLGEPEQEKESDIQTFATGEDFETAWKKITGVGHV